MSVVMILHGHANGRSTPYDGQYLKDMNFEAHDGRGELETTPHLDEAKVFPDFVAALEFYKRVPANKAIRPDLKPNRPLTASNWEFKTID